MIWGYHYFWKHPYTYISVKSAVLCCGFLAKFSMAIQRPWSLDGLFERTIIFVGIYFINSSRGLCLYGCQPKNRGIWPPKWMVKIMVPNPIKMGWFGGTPIFGNTHIPLTLGCLNHPGCQWAVNICRFGDHIRNLHLCLPGNLGRGVSQHMSQGLNSLYWGWSSNL